MAKQISAKLQSKLQKVFKESYTHIAFASEIPSLEYHKNISIEDYFKDSKDTCLSFKIFIVKNRLESNEDNISKEFAILSTLFDNEPMAEAGRRCYFVDINTLNKCKEYFKAESESKGTFYDILEDVVSFGFGYLDGNIKK